MIVRRLPLPEPVEGEVYVPASQQKPLNEGIVIAVGPSLYHPTMQAGQDVVVSDLNPGDTVCFVDYAGFEIEVDGETYLSLRDEEIHGKRI